VALIGWHWPHAVPTTQRELDFEREHNILVWPNGSPTVNRWAMALLILLLAIALGNFLFSYFYLRLEHTVWPSDNIAPPELMLPGIATLLMLAAAGAMRWTLGRIRGGSVSGLKLGSALTFVAGAAALGVLLYDFSRLPFDHTLNAYTSIFFLIGGFLMVLLVIGLGQNLYVQAVTWLGRYNQREHVAVELNTTYWTAASAMWVVAAATIYLAPYFL
jgi:cytochrome c oxidase subunit 3/cytochrome c oxidase subunit I+III